MADEQAVPNSKGPVQEQMSPELAARLGLTPKPEDVGTLSIEYRDGRPVIVVTGGKTVPVALPLLNADGIVVAAYRAAEAPAASLDMLFDLGDDEPVYDWTQYVNLDGFHK
ncbi:hypothetical protein [Embleya sp. NPDC005971]|uniref:hypothetical protein n=1 Tax=Embleya sp. NPDC005971 TaxID=3156724 RepID=UPI0033F68AC4